MTETPEVMRQHIEETKSQLWEKLDTLESQVSDAVQSTSNAVSETVASVQETVSNVTESVNESVQSVSNAFDFSLQVGRHPWIAVGGSFVLGYLANELLHAPTTETVTGTGAEVPAPSAVQAQNGNGHAVEPSPKSSSKSLVWAEMKGMLAGALMGTVSTIVSRGVPTALDYLAKSLRDEPNSNPIEGPVGGQEWRRSPK